LRIAKTLNYTAVDDVVVDEKKQQEIRKAVDDFYGAMNDDLNTAVGIAQLFALLKYVNILYLNQLQSAALGEEVFKLLKDSFIQFMEGVLGLIEEKAESNAVLDGMLTLYREYKDQKQYDKVDQVRSYFKAQGLAIKDMKHRIDWAYEE
jgi:cysteinyl-tRNA synthetase